MKMLKTRKTALIVKSLLSIGLLLIVFSFRTIAIQKEQNKSELVVKTDKTEYSQSELINISITNHLNADIFSHIGSGTPIFAIRFVEREIKNGSWEKFYAQCQHPDCMADSDAPQLIKPCQSVSMAWNPLLFIEGSLTSMIADAGTYRILILYMDSEMKNWTPVYSNNFKIN